MDLDNKYSKWKGELNERGKITSILGAVFAL